MHTKRIIKNVLLGLLLLTYPFIVYFGLFYFEPNILAIVVAVLLLLRHFSQPLNAKNQRGTIPHLNSLLLAVMSLLIYSGFTNSALALKFYPVVVSLSFLMIFSYSLFKPPSVIEVFARLQNKNDEQELEDFIIVYTRRVTLVWCIFFIVNAAISIWTIYHVNPEYWLVYNGIISYVFMGVLMLAELFIRKLVKAKNSSAKSTKTNNSQ